MFSPGSGTWQYRSTRSAVIRSRVTGSGGAAWLTTALYQPFIQCQASLWSGGSNPISHSIYSSASSVRRHLYPLMIALIAWPRRRMRDWSLSGPRHTDTLSSAILHVSAKIHVFSWPPMPLVWEWPFVGPQRVCPPSSGWLGARGGAACATQDNWCVTSEGCYVGILGPCSGPSYAVGPGRPRS